MDCGQPPRPKAQANQAERPKAQANPAGRRRVTSRVELEQIAFGLFDRDGFEQTTVDEIAAAAGIGRRTFFRYFSSKNDIPWGMFERELERMRVRLKACPPEVALMDAIREALVDFNQVEPAQIPWHRKRMTLILRVPALLAHSTLRFAAWRDVVAEFVGERTGQRPDALAPQTVAHAVLGVAVAAYEQWLDDENADLGTLLDTAMRELDQAFGRLEAHDRTTGCDNRRSARHGRRGCPADGRRWLVGAAGGRMCAATAGAVPDAVAGGSVRGDR